MSYQNQSHSSYEQPTSQSETSTFTIFMTIFVIIFLITIMSVVLSYMGWTSEQVLIVMIIITVFIILPSGAIYYWMSSRPKPSYQQNESMYNSYSQHYSPQQPYGYDQSHGYGQPYGGPVQNIPFNIDPSNTKKALLSVASPEMRQTINTASQAYNQAKNQINDTMGRMGTSARNLQNQFQTGLNYANSFFGNKH